MIRKSQKQCQLKKKEQEKKFFCWKLKNILPNNLRLKIVMG